MGAGEITEENDPDRFFGVVSRAIAALEGSEIPYAVIGAAAQVVHGAPEPLEDLDVLVRRGDVDRALDALARSGFEPDRDGPAWLAKARTGGVLVDVIFDPRRGVVLTEDQIRRRRRAAVRDIEVWMLAPEDQVLLDLASDDRETPGHWRTALELLRHTPIDWRLLEPRGEGGRERLLALLLVARSEGIPVPEETVRRIGSSA